MAKGCYALAVSLSSPQEYDKEIVEVAVGTIPLDSVLPCPCEACVKPWYSTMVFVTVKQTVTSKKNIVLKLHQHVKDRK